MMMCWMLCWTSRTKHACSCSALIRTSLEDARDVLARVAVRVLLIVSTLVRITLIMTTTRR